MPRFAVLTASGLVEGDVMDEPRISLMRGIAQKTADVYEKEPTEEGGPSKPFNPSEERIHQVLGTVDRIVRIPKPMINGQTEYWMTEFLSKRTPTFTQQ